MRSKPLDALFLIAVCLLTTRASSVFAHDGHGLTGSHWHASDVLWFMAPLAALALAVWLSRGKK
jgi:hypothetical protein